MKLQQLLSAALFCGATLITMSETVNGQRLAETHPSDTIRVMTFNLHAGHDASLEQIGELIKRYNPDFVALQEVDHKTMRRNCPHQNGRDCRDCGFTPIVFS